MPETTRNAGQFTHDRVLSLLARAEPENLSRLAETLIPRLGDIEVVQNRTGLVMLPMRDTAKGTAFHLGEVLVSEAHIRVGSVEGYGMRKGRDLEAAMAMALIDLAVAMGEAAEEIESFLTRQADSQSAEDRKTLCRIEATRVDMETF